MDATTNAAILVAKIMGPILIFFALWYISLAKTAKKAMSELSQSAGLQFVYGLIHLLLGFAIVSVYNVWALNIFLSVTLLGWALILRGLSLWFISDKFIKVRTSGGIYPIILKFVFPIWGIILSWAAYFA